MVVEGPERGILMSSWFTYLKASGMLAAPHCTPAGSKGRILAFLLHTPLRATDCLSLTSRPSKADLEEPHQISPIGRKVLNLKYLKRIHLAQPPGS